MAVSPVTRLWQRMRAACVGMLALCGAGPALAGAGQESLQQFFSGLHSLESRFTQIITNPRQGLVERSHGTLQILRPGRFRWHYEAPYEQLIVTDGETLWVYDPDLEQATRSELDESIGNTPAMLLSSDRPLDEWFRISGLGETEGLAWVLLEPREAETNFTRMRLAFDDGVLRAMELDDSFEQTILIRFDDMRRNAAVAPSVFEFRPPPGVDVVGPPER